MSDGSDGSTSSGELSNLVANTKNGIIELNSNEKNISYEQNSANIITKNNG
jgi:hypothetical protein